MRLSTTRSSREPQKPNRARCPVAHFVRTSPSTIRNVRKIAFIAMLLCAAAACMLVGGIAAYESVDYRMHSQRATMELADPGKKISISSGGLDLQLVDVRYVSSAGDLVFPRKRVSSEIARKLASGARLPVVYLTNNPQHADFTEVELPNPWGWLGLGLLLLFTGVYALRLLRRESR